MLQVVAESQLTAVPETNRSSRKLHVSLSQDFYALLYGPFLV